MGGGIGFSGTRSGLTKIQRTVLRIQMVSLMTGAPAFDHGDCIGADAEAHNIAVSLSKKWKGMGIFIRVHPPDVDKYRAFCKASWVAPPKPYLERNKDIVNNTNALIACPGEFEEQKRSGTWSTIRYARKQGKVIHIIFPDGSIQIETHMFDVKYPPPIGVRKIK